MGSDARRNTVKKATVVISGGAGWWEKTMEDVATGDRPMTIGEAIGLAIQLQQTEQYAAAEEIYRQVLAFNPDCAEAMHFLGVLEHQRGRSDAAIALIERSLELAGDRADWHSNHGIVLQERL